MKKKIKKIIKRMVLYALALALLLIPVGILAFAVVMCVIMLSVFINPHFSDMNVLQYVFTIAAFVFFVYFAPDVCHFVEKYV